MTIREGVKTHAKAQANKSERDIIIENVMQLICPRCHQAYPEIIDGQTVFDGCFALTCDKASCGCGFCGYCFTDCEADAHSHVILGQCSNLCDGLFPSNSKTTFKNALREWRARRLIKHLNGMPDEKRNALMLELERELRDLGLATIDFLVFPD